MSSIFLKTCVTVQKSEEKGEMVENKVKALPVVLLLAVIAFLVFFRTFSTDGVKTAELIDETGGHSKIEVAVKSPKRLLNLGLPKTGTTSLGDHFRDVFGNKHSAHFDSCRPKKEFKSLLKSQKGYCLSKSFCSTYPFLAKENGETKLLKYLDDEIKVIAQMDCLSKVDLYFPEVTLLEELLSGYSDEEVVFVLTTRETSSWVDSVSRWNNLQDRLMAHFKKGALDQWNVFKEISSENPKEYLATFKDWHEARVISLAKKYNRKLYILDLGNKTEFQQNLGDMTNDLTDGVLDGSNKKYEWSNHNWLHPGH